MFRKIFTLCVFILFTFICPKPIFAAREFVTSYDLSYDVAADGVTNVIEKTTLRNLTNTYFASSFVLTIGSTNLTDIVSYDDGGNMETTIATKDNKTTVTVKFNQQITGVDKKQSFILKYKSNDFTQHIGQIWEINLPRVYDSTDVESFNVNLSVPLDFGEPTSITPKPKSESDILGKLVFNFTKDQMENSGISVNFGLNQIFDFNLIYDLNNSSFLPTVSSVTLPPDTNYQDINIQNINPKPLNVTVDEDGNYLAWYQIPKRSSQQIQILGLAKLYINQKINYSPKLSAKEISAWTKSDRYWEKDNPNIKAVLSDLFKNGSPKSVKEKARSIYQYVVMTLGFDLNSKNTERMGAVTSLINPQKSTSQEFTDLFIALARAEGIPARELDGFAYSKNNKLRPLSLVPGILHGWPEYYDEIQSGWVMVDPTWENTSGGVDYFNKLDLNHLILAIKGNSSVFPSTTNQIVVNISSKEFAADSNPEVEILVNENLAAGFPATAEIKILNNGGTILSGSDLNISTDKINLLGSNKMFVNPIPPFGSASYTFNLRTPFSLESFQNNITVNYGNKNYQKQVTIKPVFLLQFFPYFFSILIILILVIYFSVLGIHFRKRKKSA